MTARSDLSLGAFALSVCLHAAVLLVVLPRLAEKPVIPPQRMEVALAQLTEAEAESPAQPEAPPVEPLPPQPEVKPQPQPKPVRPEKPVPLPVLTAPPESESAPAAHVVPAAPLPEPAMSAPPDTAPPAPAMEQAPASLAQPAKSGPPPVAKLDGKEEAGEDEAWQGYGQLVHDLVSRNKQYPQIAIRRNLEGRATVSARFSMGKLIGISLMDSSGHKVLDDKALEMVRKAVSELPVKDNLARKSFTVVVPVDFHLQG